MHSSNRKRTVELSKAIHFAHYSLTYTYKPKRKKPPHH